MPKPLRLPELELWATSEHYTFDLWTRPLVEEREEAGRRSAEEQRTEKSPCQNH